MQMSLSDFCCDLPRTLRLIYGSRVMRRSKRDVRVIQVNLREHQSRFPLVNATTRRGSQLVGLTSLKNDSWKNRNDTAFIQITRNFIPCLSTHSLTFCVSLWSLAVELWVSDTNDGFGDVFVGETVCVCIFSRNVPFNDDVIIDVDDVAIGAVFLWPFAVVMEIVLISCGVEGCSVTGRADSKTPTDELFTDDVRDELFTDDVSWPKRHERLLLGKIQLKFFLI